MYRYGVVYKTHLYTYLYSVNDQIILKCDQHTYRQNPWEIGQRNLRGRWIR